MNWLFFKKPPRNGVAIRKLGRDEWLYQDGKRKMRIYAELLAGGEGLEIDFGAMLNWLPPHEREPLAWEQRERILQEFCRYLTQRKIPWQTRK